MNKTRQLGVPALPLFQPSPLAGRFAVLLSPGQEFHKEAVAGLLEGVGGTLEALEELGADQTADLFLPVLHERIDGLVVAHIVTQGIVNSQGEERLVLLERLLDHAEQAAIGSLDRVGRNHWRLADREHREIATLLLLALLDIGAAPLDDQFLEHPVGGKRPLGLGKVRLGDCIRHTPCAAGRRHTECAAYIEQFPLHVNKVPPQGMDAELLRK